MPDSSGIISRADLDRLADLFGQYDGAIDPLSDACQDAEYQFNALIEQLYTEKVTSSKPSVSLSEFRCYSRRACRLILAKRGAPYPCVVPEVIPDDDGCP
jgi:hypothetical protein